jgi:hypothetical protein
VPPTRFAADEWVPNLRYDDSLHVITMTSGELGVALKRAR